MHMRSVTRKAALTAGLGVALAAGATGAAGAATAVTDTVADLAPTVSQARSSLPDATAPFSLTQTTDRVPAVETLLTPGNNPLDNVSEDMAHGTERVSRSMARGMTAMGDVAQEMAAQEGRQAGQSGQAGQEEQAKGGLGSPLGGGSPLGASSPLGSPLGGLQSESPLGNGTLPLK
jgi:hypothetical protein